ncbi:MAG: hypothetical protein AAB347_02350 [Bacteroidota bacterium]
MRLGDDGNIDGMKNWSLSKVEKEDEKMGRWEDESGATKGPHCPYCPACP